jgi:hypothetical protein
MSNLLFRLTSLLLLATLSLFADTDKLPSWNSGASKSAIYNFIRLSCNPSSPDYVKPEDRIATFDQDGTLWVEQPLYTEAAFALDRIKELAPSHLEWKTAEPFKSILQNDAAKIAAFSEEDWERIVGITHAGMDSSAFLEIVKKWLSQAKHPRFNKLYTELVYQPMIELIKYLQLYGFKTYIVTGGGQEFVRAYGQSVYGIPPEQVIGSSVATKYVYQDQKQAQKPVLMRQPELFFDSNYDGKAIGINLFIGKVPSAAFGNSSGDREMLEWTQTTPKAPLMMLVLHDDPVREYAYGPADKLPDTKVGTFPQDLMDEAKKRGWIVISMKNDWKTIFAAPEK